MYPITRWRREAEFGRRDREEKRVGGGGSKKVF